MKYIIEDIFGQLFLWLNQLVGTVFKVFRLLAGLDKTDDGSTIMDSVLGTEIVTRVFIYLAIISVGLAGICVVISVIKQTVRSDGQRKPIARIVGQGLSSFLITIILSTVVVLSVQCGNMFLTEVDKAFNAGQASDITYSLVQIAVSDDATYIQVPKLDENGDQIPILDENGDQMLDGEGEPMWEMEWQLVASSSGWNDSTFDPNSDDFDLSKWDINTISVGRLLGTQHKGWMGIFPNDRNNNGIIKTDHFNFLVAYLGVIFILIALCMNSFALVKRIFDIILLYLALPLVIATIPLDDGAKFKAWRETFVSKFMLSYGAVFAVNVFILTIPILMGLSFSVVLGSKFAESIVKLFLIVGAGLAMIGGQVLFSRLFGTEAAESAEAAQMGRALMAGGALAGGLAFGAAKMATGGKSLNPIKAVSSKVSASRDFKKNLGAEMAQKAFASGQKFDSNAYRGLTKRSGEKVANALQKSLKKTS